MQTERTLRCRRPLRPPPPPPKSEEGSGDFRSKKRLRVSAAAKFQVNERGEVRSVEEGFLGSWHPCKVVHSEKRKRHVRYENVLDDSGLDNLVEVVSVSKALDGYLSSSDFHRRGIIRPLPPWLEFDNRDLKFGLCVDVYHEEAWWEGVIFDHCDGMEERSVFFPDMGDEMRIGVDDLRITQDWDEVTENWEKRGKWVFLELIEECERESYVAASAKQIWYDVRGRKDFGEIGEWTWNVKYLLKNMVMEVVSDYWTLTVNEIYSALDVPGCSLDETQQMVIANSELKESVLVEKDLTVFPKEISCCGAGDVVSGAIHSAKRRKWNPLKLSGVEFCAGAVKQYALSKSKGDKQIWMKVVKHLAHLGWEIEWEERKSGAKHYRYTSPDKLEPKVYYSLVKLCNVLSNSNMHGTANCQLPNVLHNPSEEIEDPDSCPQIEPPPSVAVVDPRYCPQALQPQNDQPTMLPRVGCLFSNVDLKSSEKVQDLDNSQIEPPPSVVVVDEPGYCPQALQPQKNPSEKSRGLDNCPPPTEPPSVAAVDKPEYCPEAVMVYYSDIFKKNCKAGGVQKWRNKAKNHLLAEGWIFDYPPPNNRKRGIIFTSPQNRQFRTLHAACKFCIEVSNLKWNNSDMQPLNVSAIDEENVLLPKEPELLTTDVVALNSSTANRKRRNIRNSKTSLLKIQGNGLPLQVMRSNKRVQKVSATCLSHQKPLNVLSWLIDSNMVLPRSKVYYHGKGCLPMPEGRITRDGIKCSCCLKIYSPAGFENHASGSSTHRPAASIFLEDGRSLLDCKIQLMQDHKARETAEKPFSDLCQGENDYICSVCHYGGELILCDKCPSSFHHACLGLKVIPDGDWFCPSCRCGICGQRKTDGDEDETFLTCIQCEHKYHIRCLTNRNVDKSRRYRENWFCGEDCQKIYAGLHELVGVPVSVGADNLTWTLMKFTDFESCDLGGTKGEFLAESFSKLNVALSLMHECFEHMSEPFSSRDLMENVIFSRRSELHRLNFRGFYIVLLERNEEMISVATIRVYGGKVAEVPLVGTRFQYRRHGMCRILMNELEKKLVQLGVERLVLPAVPTVLGTWTGSFGFVKMTNFERSQFLDYTFLDFQDTIMCQKQLMKIRSPHSVLSIEFQQKHDDFSGSSSVNFDKSSPVSEVNQAGEADERGMQDQQTKDDNAGNDEDDHHLGSSVVDPDMMVKQTCGEVQQVQHGTSSQCSLERQADRYKNGSYKFYKRRKLRETS